MIVEELFERHGTDLKWSLICGQEGLKKTIASAQVERPGLGLLGFKESAAKKPILIFGRSEIAFLKAHSPKEKKLALKRVLGKGTPFLALSHSITPPQEMVEWCEKEKIPLFQSSLQTACLFGRLHGLLADLFAPCLSCHGCLVEIFGLGVLIQGEASVGKSEAALSLIGKGHRLIADDLVRLKKLECGSLEGSGVDISRHHMEVKNVGIINIPIFYGASCVLEKKILDIVVKLEVWNDSHFSERRAQKQKTLSLLGLQIPYYLIPVKPGREVVLLLEAIALNHRVKMLSAIESRGKQRLWQSN